MNCLNFCLPGIISISNSFLKTGFPDTVLFVDNIFILLLLWTYSIPFWSARILLSKPLVSKVLTDLFWPVYFYYLSVSMEKGGLKFPSPPFITLTTLRCVILITQHIGVSAVMCHLLLFRPILQFLGVLATRCSEWSIFLGIAIGRYLMPVYSC